MYYSSSSAHISYSCRCLLVIHDQCVVIFDLTLKKLIAKSSPIFDDLLVESNYCLSTKTGRDALILKTFKQPQMLLKVDLQCLIDALVKESSNENLLERVKIMWSTTDTRGIHLSLIRQEVYMMRKEHDGSFRLHNTLRTYLPETSHRLRRPIYMYVERSTGRIIMVGRLMCQVFSKDGKAIIRDKDDENDSVQPFRFLRCYATGDFCVNELTGELYIFGSGDDCFGIFK